MRRKALLLSGRFFSVSVPRIHSPHKSSLRMGLACRGVASSCLDGLETAN